jgi:hypothetical protein
MDARTLEYRLSRLLLNWNTLPQESMKLADAARKALDNGELIEAYSFLVLADSYVITSNKQ